MDKSVLIISNRKDFTSDLLIRRLIEKKIKFLRLNTEDFPLDLNSKIEISDKKFTLSLQSSKYNFEPDLIKSIWYRRPVLPLLETGLFKSNISLQIG